MKKIILITMVLFGLTPIMAQNCRIAITDEYDADTDIEYSKLIGGIIYDDGAKAIFTDFQDIIALYAAKTTEGELLIYLQQTRYVDSNNSTARDDLSIKKGDELILIGDFGKLNLVAHKDQSPSTDVKAMTRQTKNKICQIYPISAEDLQKLCSGQIKTLIINYETAPKTIKKLNPKKVGKHAKMWACAPNELI